MKKVIRLTDSKLHSLINRVIREQEEEQIMATGPQPEDVTGSPEEEGGDPNFDAFISAAQELLGQGLTVGDLVDKICEAQQGGEETEPEVEPTEPEQDQGIPSDNQ
jgi:hypothetical protein